MKDREREVGRRANISQLSDPSARNFITSYQESNQSRAWS